MQHRTATDQQLSGLLANLYTAHSALVVDVVTRNLRAEDVHQAEDIAQTVWVGMWQFLLRGNSIDGRIPGLLTTMARHKVIDHYRLARVRREVPVDSTDDAQAGTRLAQVNRPTERHANLTDRELPPLSSAVELLRIARRNGDRYGVRLFSRLVDRILDADYAARRAAAEKPATLTVSDGTKVTVLRPAPAAAETDDWTGADYDSYQVLAELGAIDPAAAVAHARCTQLADDSTARGWAA